MRSFPKVPAIILQSIIAIGIAVVHHAHLSTAFTLNTHLNFHSRSRSNSSPLQGSSTRLHQSSNPSDVFVLSYDGVVADTNNWRANLAINVALETWPHLQQYPCIENTDTEWLVNKVLALLSVTLADENGMVGCDAVLLARMLIEEQLLDDGRSNGCKGKYGSKFHPAAGDDDDEYDREDNGSRPLTVGEITANWNDGACLKDTVRIKYNVDRKDPIPIIKERIRDYLEDEASDFKGVNVHAHLPDLYPSIAEALLDCGSPVYILVGDKSHVPTAIASLSQLNVPIQTTSLGGDDLQMFECNSGCITIVSPGDGGLGHEDVFQHILSSVNKGSSVHLVHSDVSTLQQAKSLFGDNRPRPGVFEMCTGSFKNVSLKLSLSTLNSGPQQQNDAIMDPWLNLIDEFELVENLSARIVYKK